MRKPVFMVTDQVVRYKPTYSLHGVDIVAIETRGFMITVLGGKNIGHDQTVHRYAGRSVHKFFALYT